MRVDGVGLWTDAARWLDAVRIPVRVGVATAAGPRVVSLWYQREGETLWCATQRDAAIVTYLHATTTVGFEVAVDFPPYRGVRGTAEVILDEARGPAMIDALVGRYLTDRNRRLGDWLHQRRDDEVAIGLTITRITSWDFSARMTTEDPDWLVPPGSSPSPT